MEEHRRQHVRWASAALDVLKRIKQENIQCKFVVRSIDLGKINMGDLLVFTENGQMKMISDILIDMHLAKPVSDENERK